jgi:hypothetical protein
MAARQLIVTVSSYSEFLMRRTPLALVLCAGVLSGCFHQTIQTGRTPGSTTLEKEYVATWLWGIVPAKPIDVRQQCPGGVATIETQQTFMNGFVAVLTLGIYSPQYLKVTCAASTASVPPDAIELRVPSDASDDERARFVSEAIARSVETGLTVVLRY